MQTTATELESLAAGLASEDEAARLRAFTGLCSLSEEALPAIVARTGTMRRPPLNETVAYDILRLFRHEVGSNRADDMVDIAPGVLPVLGENRRPTTLKVAERLALLRSLEAMATPEAGRALADLISYDFVVWRWEARRIVHRMQTAAVPMLIEARGHAEVEVRRWARRGLRGLGMADAAEIAQLADTRRLADSLRAYGVIKDMDAMRVVVSFVTHDRAQVRSAARWATEQYGQNAVWQLRRVYRNTTGERPDRAWGWRRTMDALFAAHDQERLGPVRGDLEAGLAAHAAGDLDEMRERFEEVLLRAPDLPQRAQMAAGYADLGAASAQAGELREAARFYRRAIRLEPDGALSDARRAELTFVLAEHDLRRGVADAEAYEQVLALVPEHEGATDALATFAEHPQAARESKRRWAGAAAALLFAIAGWFFFIRRRRRGEDDLLEDLALEDEPVVIDTMDTAPDTLPG